MKKTTASIIAVIFTIAWVISPDLIPFIIDDALLIFATYKGWTQKLLQVF